MLKIFQGKRGNLESVNIFTTKRPGDISRERVFRDKSKLRAQKRREGPADGKEEGGQDEIPTEPEPK